MVNIATKLEDLKQQVKNIDRILNCNMYTTCRHCKLQYLPFSELTSDFCPVCESDKIRDIKQLMFEVEDVE